MNFTQDLTHNLDKIHADHQLRKITTRIAREIDDIRGEHTEIKERLTTMEEKGGKN